MHQTSKNTLEKKDSDLLLTFSIESDERDGLARQCLDEDLHRAAAQAQIWVIRQLFVFLLPQPGSTRACAHPRARLVECLMLLFNGQIDTCQSGGVDKVATPAPSERNRFHTSVNVSWSHRKSGVSCSRLELTSWRLQRERLWDQDPEKMMLAKVSSGGTPPSAHCNTPLPPTRSSLPILR